MVTEAIYKTLVLMDLLLIVASLWFRAKLVRIYQIALLLTAIGLACMSVALVGLLTTPNPPEGYMLGVKILLVFMAPLLLEFIILLLIWRRHRGAT